MQHPRLEDIIKAVDERFAVAEGMLNELRSRTADGPGVTRASYGVGEQIGHDLMRAAAKHIGLDVSTDAAGNLYATLQGSDQSEPRWITGSHFDSVPCGGNFDGAAGVVASLMAVAVLKDLGLKPRHDISAMAIRAEECSSWFTGRHGGHLGSRAALGLLDPVELETAKHAATGATLAHSIDVAGFDSASVRTGPPPLSKSNVRGFIELHIEQGPVLVEQGVPIGIVTGIRGTLRVRNGRCTGAYSHSGAVPQHLRRDAVLATAELITRMDEYCRKLRDANNDVVFAVGRIHTNAKLDSLSKVPGEVSFTIDLRSQDHSILAELNTILDQLGAEIASRRSVCFEFGGRAAATPTVMDASFRALLSSSSRDLELRAPDIACGAGHDTAEFVRAGIPSSMIFVRNTGESHNPDEHMEMRDFRAGILLLSLFLAQKIT